MIRQAPTTSTRGRCARARSTSTCSPSPNPYSRSPTATSGCAATSTRASPTACPGTYLNGFYESVPLPYAEAGYGYPESGQTVVNATNGKLIRLLVEDEPFDLRYGRLESHERVPRPARGHPASARPSGPRPPATRVRITSTRLVSLAQRSIAAIDYSVEPVDKPLRVVVQSELVANEPLPGRGGRPARRGARRRRSSPSCTPPTTCARCSSTGRSRSELRMAAGYDHVVDCAADLRTASQSEPDFARTTFSARIEPGKPLRLTKFVAYGWSPQRSVAGAARPGRGGGARGDAHRLGRARAPQREYLDDVLGPGRRRDRRRGAPAAGAALRDVPRASGRRAQRGARDPGQGPDRLGLRRARLLGHRDVRAPDAHLLDARGGARRAQLAPLDARQGLRARQPARPRGRGVPVADDRRRGVLELLARGHRGVSRQRRHRQRGRALLGVDRRRGLRAASTGSSCSSRRRGCGARSATTTPTARFGSTASPGPTSTSPSPTTTSTPTSARRRT